MSERTRRTSSGAGTPAATSNIDRRRGIALQNGQDSYQERRLEIAKAAAGVFNKLGYQGTSMGAVADALGMSRASLYYYIANKRELFDEVVLEAAEVNVAAAEAVLRSDAPATEKLRTLIIELMKSYGTHYPLLYIYLRENLSHVEGSRTDWSQRIRKLNQRYEAIFVSIVQEGIDSKAIRPIATAKMLAYGIIGMMGWTSRWFVPHKSAESAEEIGAAFAEMVLGGLKS